MKRRTDERTNGQRDYRKDRRTAKRTNEHGLTEGGRTSGQIE